MLNTGEAQMKMPLMGVGVGERHGCQLERTAYAKVWWVSKCGSRAAAAAAAAEEELVEDFNSQVF